MTTTLSLTASLAAACLPVLLVQDLVPVAPDEPALHDDAQDLQQPPREPGRIDAPAALDPTVPAEHLAWRERLSAPDFAERAAALDEAAALARIDAGLRASLETWSSGDGELAWTAFLALREADRAPTGIWIDPGQAWSPPHGIPEDAYIPFTHPPGTTFGPNGPLWPTDPAWPGLDLDADHGLPGGIFGDDHPFGGPGGLELDAPFAPGLPGLRLLPPPAPEPVVGGPVTRTDVLGVMVAGAPTDDSGPAGGLLVDSVVAGTIAAHVGLESGDLVIEVAGSRVRNADDVSAALEQRAEGALVKVRWVDEGGTLETGTWTPPAS